MTPVKVNIARHVFEPPVNRDWREQAACLGTDPEMFYADDGSGDIAEVKSICMRCRVSEDCLDYALATHEKYGLWGGMTPKERSREARRRLRATLAERRMV